MSGIRPRIAPTMNYGIVGTNIYSDVIDGATQLMGIVNQGRRDKTDAEFRRESMDFREDQFDYQKGQDLFDNMVTAHREGINPATIPGADQLNPDEMARARTAATQAQQTTKFANVVQGALDDSAKVNASGAGFSPQSATQIDGFMQTFLNPTGRTDAKIEMSNDPKVGMTYNVDQQSYDIAVSAAPELAQYLGVVGDDNNNGKPITRELMTNALGQSIQGLNTRTTSGKRDYETLWGRFRTSPATSPNAADIEFRGAQSKLQSYVGKVASTLAKGATDRIMKDARAQGMSDDPTILDAQDSINTEVEALSMDFSTRAEKAKDLKEIRTIEAEFHRNISAMRSRASRAVGAAVTAKKVETRTPKWVSKGHFNYNKADVEGFRSETKEANREKLTSEARGTAADLTAMAVNEAETAFYDANGVSEQTVKDLAAWRNTIEQDIYTAMASNTNKLPARTREFLEKHSGNFLGFMGDSGIGMFDPVDPGLGKPKPAAAGGGLGSQAVPD